MQTLLSMNQNKEVNEYSPYITKNVTTFFRFLQANVFLGMVSYKKCPLMQQVLPPPSPPVNRGLFVT